MIRFKIPVLRTGLFAILGVTISLVAFPQQKIRIACIGNSITFGATIEEREKYCYPAQMASLLGNGYEVVNFGRNGATLLSKGDIPYRNTDQYQQALQFNPDLVFIGLGANDTKPVNREYLGEFVQDYKDLVFSFRSLPASPRIVLLTPLPAFTVGEEGISAAIIRDEIVPFVRQVAFETGCEVINMYNLFIESPELFPDKVHPNSSGAKVMAERLAEVVKMKSDPEFDLSRSLLGDAEVFNFHGYQGFSFKFRNRSARVVVPKKTAKGHPWIWRSRFWDHEPQTDIALLERGYHVVWCDVAELFGNDEALSIWNGFYKMLTRYGLAVKAVMEGMSRGGVYIYRWLVRYPMRVAAVYADAPVLDMKSWPGGKGKGSGNQENWEIFKKSFGLKSDNEALAFKGNPMDKAAQIAKTGIPLLHVVGDADVDVPPDENTNPFEKKITASGGTIQVIHKPGIGHHPHSLRNPQPIVDFILKASSVRNKQPGERVPAR